MDKLSRFSSSLYALLLIVGGIIGYTKAHSKWSLIIGLLCGILIFLSNKFGSFNPKMQYLSVALISLLLAIFFYIRFNTTHTFMPSGLMLILSTATFVIIGIGWTRSKR